MAQTSYDQYLQQLMGDAYQQQGQGGMMAQPRSIAPADVSGIQNAFAGLQQANAKYEAPKLSDLSKVREDFLAKKAEESQAKLQELLGATQAQGGGMMSSSGGQSPMSTADFVSQLAYGIQNVQTLVNMGIMPKSVGEALINDAMAKAKAADPLIGVQQDPAPVRNYSSGSGGGGYNPTFGSMSGAEGASIGAGGE